MTRNVQDRVVDLSGSWEVAREEADTPDGQLPGQGLADWLEATVPSSVHYDLVRAGRLDNPFAGSAAADGAAWVCASDWTFRRHFSVGPELLTASRLALEFDGVDTFAEVWVNGALVGRTANAYRSYRFDLDRSKLHAGANELLVRVKAHHRMVADMVPEAREHLGSPRNPYSYSGKSLLRRYQRSFFGGASLINLGTEILGIGIYKPVRLVALQATRIEDFHFRVERVGEDSAQVSLEVELAGPGSAEPLAVTAALTAPDGEVAATAGTTAAGTAASLDLRVPRPRLWWPHGYGEQNLYGLRIDVRDASGRVALVERKVGLKRVELVKQTPTGRRTFQFVVNGRPIWVRGQNPIPIDYIAVHGPDDAYDRLLRLVVEGNGNLIRIWGGGAIENEHFFDECDRLGIMLWQDFFLHSTVYPDYDEAWVDGLRQESVELVHLLRNHACLSLLCGGNEQQQGWDEWGWQGELDRFYGEPLIKELLPAVAGAEAPEIPYIENSPHGGRTEAAPDEGEMHCWGNYINATKDPLFITETCWNLHSYSRPETLAAVMDLDVDAYSGRGWPGRWTNLTKLPLVTKYPYSDQFASRTLAEYLRSLEIEHLQADYFALKSLRLTAPSLTGIVNWSFNKGGPLFEFGCVDYLGYPMMNFYGIKRLFADVVVGVYRDIDDIRVVASNVTDRRIEGDLRLTHLDSKGSVIAAWQEPVSLAPGQTSRIGELPARYASVVDRSRELVHAELLVSDRPAGEDTLYFVPLAHFDVVPEPVSARVEPAGLDRWGSPTWTVELSTSTVQKLVQIEGNQKWVCSDNYFTLVPGRTRRVTASLLERTTPGPAELHVSTLDVPGVQTFTLEGRT